MGNYACVACRKERKPRVPGARMPEDDAKAPLIDDSKRSYVLKEILDTERTYVKNLDLVKRVFIVPLRDAGTLSAAELRAVFSDWEVILHTNTMLFNDFEAYFQGKKDSLGKVFLSMVGFLKVYTGYCNNFNVALKTVSTLRKKNSKFAAFVEEARHNAECAGLDINAFLIMPVQRIPRYNLLLSELLKHTSPSHPDYYQLHEALEKMKETAEVINEQKREAENLEKVLYLQDNLVGIGDVHLVTPTRRFVLEHTFAKRTVTIAGDKSDKRHLVLFNDALLYAEQSGMVHRKREFKFKALWPVDAVSVQELDEEVEKFPADTSLVLVTPAKSMTLCAQDVGVEKAAALKSKFVAKLAEAQEEYAKSEASKERRSMDSMRGQSLPPPRE